MRAKALSDLLYIADLPYRLGRPKALAATPKEHAYASAEAELSETLKSVFQVEVNGSELRVDLVMAQDRVVIVAKEAVFGLCRSSASLTDTQLGVGAEARMEHRCRSTENLADLFGRYLAVAIECSHLQQAPLMKPFELSRRVRFGDHLMKSASSGVRPEAPHLHHSSARGSVSKKPVSTLALARLAVVTVSPILLARSPGSLSAECEISSPHPLLS